MSFFQKTRTRIGSAIASGMALDVFTNMFKLMKEIFYTVFMPLKLGAPGTPETFEQAMKRLGLNEQAIEERKKMFGTQVLIYLAAGIAVFIYSVFLAKDGEVVGMLTAMLVGILAFSYAFRSHFWLFQLKQRRLGCTFQEWLASTIQG